MTFSRFADYLNKLESTSSRLSLIDILSELFSEINIEEIPQVSYLLQGRVAPAYEPLEMGMAERSIATSIAQAFNVNRDDVLNEYGRLGDLGLVAERISRERKGQDGKLPILEVFDILKSIALTSGEGTVEKKTTLLSDLLKKVDFIGAKHLVRIPLGTTRLGVAEPTILEAFAKSKCGDRKFKKELEVAFNKTSDLGLVGETLWRQGLEGIRNLKVTIGHPIRPQLAERLPDAQTILQKFEGEAHIQYKYDGFRVQIHKNGDDVRLFSRNLEETTLMLPEIVEGAIKQIKAKTAILDSEALAFNPESEEFLPFQETIKRKRKYGVEEMQKKLPLKAFVFDVMYYDGKSLADLSLRERMEILREAIKGEDILIPQPGEFTNSLERVTELFNDALTKGLEGLLVKKPDSKYEAGARNFNWVKLKRHSSGELKDTIDCVILGYVYGRGKRAAFGAGALLVGIYDDEKDEFVTVTKIGTGLSDDEWREIHIRADKIRVDHKPARVNSILEPSVWIQPEIVIEVLADEITKSPVHTAGKNGEDTGFALRFPRLVRFRDADKKPEDATTVKEIKEMYSLQYKK